MNQTSLSTNETVKTKTRGSLRWCWLAVAVLLIDQITKYFATGALLSYQAKPVLPFFNLTLMHNTGAAFSFMDRSGPIATWIFTAISVVISLAIIVYLRRLPANKPWSACALALVLGGALGNLLDRLSHGYVIDFLDFYYRSWHFPAFNVADSAITVGAVIWFLSTLFSNPKEKKL